MGTALIYLVVLLVVAALFFAGASAVFGRGEQLAPIPPGATPTWFPDREIGPMHVRAVRFQQAIRGYKMAEVDWALNRLAGELDRRAAESDALRSRIAELESAVAGAKQADVVALVAPSAGEPEPLNAEPLNAEPLNAEPLNAEPLNAEPLNAEPLNAEPLNAEPLNAEPLNAEPLNAEPSGASAAGAQRDPGDPERDADPGADNAEPNVESGGSREQ